MNLRIAMALSASNKAKGLNDKGQRIVVQQRYQGRLQWLHTWFIANGHVAEQDWENSARFNEEFKIDPDLDYWEPI